MERIPIALSTQALDGGGSETQLRQTAMALDRERFDVHVVYYRTNDERHQELTKSGVEAQYFPLNSFASPQTLKVGNALRTYLKQHNIKLLHAFDNPSTIFAIPCAKLAGVPVRLSSQRGHPHLYPPTYRKLQRLSETLADGIVVNAEALQNHLIREEGMKPDRIRFCPNGLDTRRYHFSERDPSRASITIGCIARQRPEKHLPFLVDAFAKMRRPGMKLMLVGSGPDEEAIRNRVAANNIASDVMLVPQTPDVPKYMSEIDIFVLCSESEGISNSLLEAMASGATVVGSKVPGTRELIREGVNGFLFEFNNAQDLSNKILRLVDDPALRQSVAASASNWVRQNMSVEASAAKMGAIYDEFLARRKLR